jgi:hypothetical protein
VFPLHSCFFQPDHLAAIAALHRDGTPMRDIRLRITDVSEMPLMPHESTVHRLAGTQAVRLASGPASESCPTGTLVLCPSVPRRLSESDDENVSESCRAIVYFNSPTGKGIGEAATLPF